MRPGTGNPNRRTPPPSHSSRARRDEPDALADTEVSHHAAYLVERAVSGIRSDDRN
jgi:hypothetical protein